MTALGSVAMAKAASHVAACTGRLLDADGTIHVCPGVVAEGTAIWADGAEFEVVAVGSTRAALIGPDGVMYRANLSGNEVVQEFADPTRGPVLGPHRSYERERALFEALAAHPVARLWCPVYTPYDDLKVMAMPVYRPTPAPVDDPLAVHHLGPGIASAAFGVDASGRLVVLGACNVSFNPEPFTA